MAGIAPDAVTSATLKGRYRAAEEVAADGTEISPVVDRSSYGKNLSQATTGQKPTIQTDGDGRRYYLFDGSNDFVTGAAAADWAFLHDGEATIFAVVELVAHSGDGRSTILDTGGLASGDKGAWLAFDNRSTAGLPGPNGINARATRGAGSSNDVYQMLAGPQALEPGVRAALAVRVFTTSARLHIDNERGQSLTDVSITFGSGSPTGALRLGARNNATTLPGHFKLYEAFFFDGILSTADRDGVFDWIVDEYGVPCWIPPASGNPVAVEATSDYDAFPSIALASNGDLVVVARRGSSHTSTFGDIVQYRSSDGGDSWTTDGTIFSGATGILDSGHSADADLRDAGLTRLNNGDLLLTVSIRGVGGSGGSVPDGCRWATSSDDGATWSALHTLNDAFVGFSRCSTRPVQIGDGSLLWPIYGNDSGDGSSTRWIKVYRSTDDGATWSYLADIGSSSDGTGWGETSLVVSPTSGNVIAVVRNDLSDDLYRSVSTDDGATWSAPSLVFADGSSSPQACYSASGLLVLTQRVTSDTNRGRILSSSDDGATWFRGPYVGTTTHEYGSPVRLGSRNVFVWSQEVSSSDADLNVTRYDEQGSFPAEAEPIGFDVDVDFGAIPTIFRTISFDADVALGLSSEPTIPAIGFDVDVALELEEPTVVGRGRIVFDADVELGVRFPTSGLRRRVLLVHQSGEVITELERAVVSDPTEELGSWETARFTLPAEDPKLELVLEKKLREVQIWRGNRLLLWGPIVRPTVSPDGCSFDVKGAAWYFARRYVGSAQIVNRLQNADFAGATFAHWRQRRGKFFLDFEPMIFGDVGLLDSPARTGARTVLVRNAWPDTAHPGAEQVTLSQDVEVTAGPFGATATLTVWVYVPEADFVSYGPEKRRGLTIVRMPLDYRTNNYFTRTGGVNGWAGSRAFYTDFLDVAVAAITENTPFDTWLKLSVSLDLPPGAHEIVTASLGGIEGITYWSKPRLTLSDGLSFSNVDQSEIVRGLVDHAQDPDFGKSDLNIGVIGSPTGILRSLFAEYAEHANIWDLISAYSKLDDGLDLSMSYASRTRNLQIHYPYRGLRRPSLELRTDRNVADWSYVFDGENASSSEIVTGAGNAEEREEAAAAETTDFADDLVLEAVTTAPPETSDDDLPELARSLLASELSPEVVTFRTFPLSPLLDELELGDIVPIRLEKKQARANEVDELVTFSVDGDWRLVRRTEADDGSLAGTLNRVPS